MIAIVDSGVANLASVMAALERLGVVAEATADAGKIRDADKIILPGVGAAAPAMAQLKTRGLIDLLRNFTRPVLGICLGMQLLFEHLDESGGVDGLGVIPGIQRKLEPAPDRPVPHMGWNTLKMLKPEHPLLKNVPEASHVYFVHSFAAPVSSSTLAATTYGEEFTAMVAHKNFFGCQFHPERSSIPGSQILKNFVEM